MTQRSPFRYFRTSPEFIRLAEMLYVRFPLSMRNLEDLFQLRDIEVSHAEGRFWRRFGPMLGVEIRKRSVGRLRSFRWRRHPDKVFVKVNGGQHSLWWAEDYEGEVLEAFVTNTRGKAVALTFPRKGTKSLAGRRLW